MAAGGTKASKAQGTRRRGYERAGTVPTSSRGRRGAGFWALLLGGLAVVTLVVGVAYTSLAGGSASNTSWVEQAPGGSWTNVDANTLADMMAKKDFTLLDVKTPYIGEIPGTDLYIPYDQLSARSSELPSDKSAKLVVYCRAGNESRVALRTLIGMGYTNLWNLDKGMESWSASGRQIIQKART